MRISTSCRPRAWQSAKKESVTPSRPKPVAMDRTMSRSSKLYPSQPVTNQVTIRASIMKQVLRPVTSPSRVRGRSSRRAKVDSKKSLSPTSETVLTR